MTVQKDSYYSYPASPWLKNTVFWEEVLCSVLKIYWHLDEPGLFILHGITYHMKIFFILTIIRNSNHMSFQHCQQKTKITINFLLSFMSFYHYTILLCTCSFGDSTDFCCQGKAVSRLATGADILPKVRNVGEIYSQTEYCSSDSTTTYKFSG